ncbi:type II toxin-antitoxin system RelE family toxin [Microcoleus sp. herbarium13]|uniref:type II toxin-antitoxin system RelE family toxin n=1 Tax=unclassified Microcoleus TaxID=2642155 RepID=UPI003FA5C886
MKSSTTIEFRKLFADLPEQVRDQTRAAYRQFKEDPSHPSLRFKKVHPELPIYSARISRNYRAVGQLDGDTVIWFWVGSHAEYHKLLGQL